MHIDAYALPSRPGMVALRARLPRGIEAGARAWNQIAYEGQWQGHGAGAFCFNQEIFERILANFGRRSDSIPLTYGHPDGETAAYHGAAGWIHELKIDTDNQGRVALFALMEFTPRSAAMVNAGEHRHCSVVVHFESVDEVTAQPVGPELLEVGLVLSAFLDGMQPIHLSRAERGLSKGAPQMDLNQFLSMLEDASPEDKARLMALLQVDMDREEDSAEDAPAAAAQLADAPVGEPVKAEDMPAEPPAEAPSGALAELAAMLGLDPAALADMSAEDLAKLVLEALQGPASADGAPAMAASRIAASKLVESLVAAQRKRADDAVAALSAAQKDAATAETEHKTRIAALEREVAEHQVDLLLVTGDLVDGRPYSRDSLIGLAHTQRALFDELVKKGEKVPTKATYRADTQADRTVAADSGDAIDIALEKAGMKVLEAHPGLNKANKKLFKRKRLELARELYPAAFRG